LESVRISSCRVGWTDGRAPMFNAAAEQYVSQVRRHARCWSQVTAIPRSTTDHRLRYWSHLSRTRQIAQLRLQPLCELVGN